MKNTSLQAPSTCSAMSPKGGGWLGFAPPWWFKNRPWMTSMEAPSFKLSKLTNSFPYHHNTTHVCASTLWSSLSLIKPKFEEDFGSKPCEKRRRNWLQSCKNRKPFGGRRNSVFKMGEREKKMFLLIYLFHFPKIKSNTKVKKAKCLFNHITFTFSHHISTL